MLQASLPPEDIAKEVFWTSVALEVWHTLNGYIVMNRIGDYWTANSYLDSYVIHTLLFVNVARYFRNTQVRVRRICLFIGVIFIPT